FLRMHEDIIPIQNMSAFHAAALNFQQEGARWSPIFWKLNHLFDVFLRQQRQPRCDPPDNGYAGYARYTGNSLLIGLPARRRWNGERPRLKPLFLEIAFPFQR